jgi:hypothetical protein
MRLATEARMDKPVHLQESIGSDFSVSRSVHHLETPMFLGIMLALKKKG